MSLVLVTLGWGWGGNTIELRVSHTPLGVLWEGGRVQGDRVVREDDIQPWGFWWGLGGMQNGTCFFFLAGAPRVSYLRGRRRATGRWRRREGLGEARGWPVP